MHQLKPILLAEDNQNDMELTLEAFADSKLVNLVTVARDGVEAMEYLKCKGKYADRKSGNPSVAIIDIKMPRMDGIEVLQAIRADESLKMIPVVMLTSSREEQDLIRSYELGINAYVVKPVKFVDFIEAVKYLGVFWAMLNERPPEKGHF
jgi:CheY-like chemotaxis protein